MPALVAKNGHPEYWKKIDRNGEEGLGRRCNMDDHGPLHTLSKVANGTGSLHTRATFTSKNIREEGALVESLTSLTIHT